MNATSVAEADASVHERLSRGQVPLWLKVIYTAFVAIPVPVYWSNYRPTNFLPTDWALKKIRQEKASS